MAVVHFRQLVELGMFSMCQILLLKKHDWDNRYDMLENYVFIIVITLSIPFVLSPS